MKKHTLSKIIAGLLLLSVFCTLDLGFNFLYNLVPEHLDGLTTNSILQAVFGIFGDKNWTLNRFYDAFERSAWASFALLSIHILLHFKKKD